MHSQDSLGQADDLRDFHDRNLRVLEQELGAK